MAFRRRRWGYQESVSGQNGELVRNSILPPHRLQISFRLVDNSRCQVTQHAEQTAHLIVRGDGSSPPSECKVAFKWTMPLATELPPCPGVATVLLRTARKSVPHLFLSPASLCGGGRGTGGFASRPFLPTFARLLRNFASPEHWNKPCGDSPSARC